MNSQDQTERDFFFLKINTSSEIFTLQTLAICQRLHFAEPTALEQEGVHKGLDGGGTLMFSMQEETNNLVSQQAWILINVFIQTYSLHTAVKI